MFMRFLKQKSFKKRINITVKKIEWLAEVFDIGKAVKKRFELLSHAFMDGSQPGLVTNCPLKSHSFFHIFSTL